MPSCKCRYIMYSTPRCAKCVSYSSTEFNGERWLCKACWFQPCKNASTYLYSSVEHKRKTPTGLSTSGSWLCRECYEKDKASLPGHSDIWAQEKPGLWVNWRTGELVEGQSLHPEGKDKPVLTSFKDADKDKHGKGVVINIRTGFAYDGEWKDNKFTKGTLTTFDGIKRTGFFDARTNELYSGSHDIKGRRQGHGVLWIVNEAGGSVQVDYAGQWVAGMRHGQGRGGTPTFEGEWRNDEVYFGKQKINGHAYEGHFSKFKPHGSGTMKYSNGDVYEGEWKRGLRSGQGRLRSRDGSTVYQGSWYSDKQDGPGVETWYRGDKKTAVYEGVWSQGKRHQCGLMAYTESPAVFREYDNGVIVHQSTDLSGSEAVLVAFDMKQWEAEKAKRDAEAEKRVEERIAQAEASAKLEVSRVKQEAALEVSKVKQELQSATENMAREREEMQAAASREIERITQEADASVERMENELKRAQAQLAEREAELEASFQEKVDQLEREASVRMDRMQEQAETAKRDVEKDRQALEEEKAAMMRINAMQQGKVKLNVGGQLFHTTTSTLTLIGDSMLASMFSGRYTVGKDEEDGCVFIDRDGKHFGTILNFMRDGDGEVLPTDKRELQELLKEATFYGLQPLIELVREKLAR